MKGREGSREKHHFLFVSPISASHVTIKSPLLLLTGKVIGKIQSF